MIENILSVISDLTPFWIYIALFFFAYIENVFPPSPSDLVVVIGGSLIAANSIHFIPTLLITTIGSVLGFMTLYFIGSKLDRKVIKTGKLKFIPTEGLDKAELWFNRYGYFIIFANRFLPGTRSVISFFAGLSELNVKKTIILATCSTLIWNTIIIYLGIIFGNNIKIVDKYLSTYSNIILTVTIVVVLFFVTKYFIKKSRAKN
ncbi:MAG: DedA family protein [Bacteroidetes bacterium]|nr:DedA family protein [Bacteroidota bacterium]